MSNILVLSTCTNAEEAERIGRGVVESKLAACVNIVPGIRSIYRWKGAVEDAQECLLVLKTRQDRFRLLTAEIRKLHSYEVPEIIGLPIIDGDAEYLAWIENETRPLDPGA